MSASQRVANAHTPSSWETSRVKIAIGWKNTYGCCRNEYDLWEVICVCLKRAAHFKKKKKWSLIWFVLLETILQSNFFFFFFPDRERFQRYTRKQQTQCQVLSAGGIQRELRLWQLSKRFPESLSPLLAEGLTPINSSGSMQKNVFYVRTHVSDTGSLNYIHLIKTQVSDTLLHSFIVFIYSYL